MSADEALNVSVSCRTGCVLRRVIRGERPPDDVNGVAGGGQPAVTIVTSGAVTATADGYVPVVLTCNLTVQCEGSLVLVVHRGMDQGRSDSKSDLVVDAGATTTLDVPLGSVALPWLQSHGSAPFSAIADAGLSFGCDGMAWSPDAPTRSGLPPCGDSPIDGFGVLSTSDLTVAAAG